MLNWQISLLLLYPWRHLERYVNSFRNVLFFLFKSNNKLIKSTIFLGIDTPPSIRRSGFLSAHCRLAQVDLSRASSGLGAAFAFRPLDCTLTHTEANQMR